MPASIIIQSSNKWVLAQRNIFKPIKRNMLQQYCLQFKNTNKGTMPII